MKYLCIVHFDGTVLDRMDPREKRDFDRESLGYDDMLIGRGKLIHAEALQSPSTASLVKVRNGQMSVTDGPYAEAKEQMGGFILIHAADMAEAQQIAAGIPLARYGTIEVRPVYEIPDPNG
jgi:hypothetical protein